MTRPEIKYDIRVVRMAKSTKSTNLQYILDCMQKIDKKRSCEGIPVNLNLCLGHFDVMMIDQVEDLENPDKNPMHKVIADYNKTMDLGRMLDSDKSTATISSETTNYFPIYMLVQMNSPTAQITQCLDNFWKKESNYTVIMRLHQEQACVSGSFREQLRARLMDASKYQGECLIQAIQTVSDFYSKLTVADKGGKTQEVFCVFYDSLELGDVVGIFKGNSLWAILQVQRWLYEARCVSDAYSYCGIRYSLLETNPLPDEIKKDVPKTTLDYVETRFSVRSSDDAWAFLESQSDSGYFVTGSADALLHSNAISEEVFLQRFCTLVHYDKLYDAFYDVVTRIGLKNRKPPRGNGDKPSSDIPIKSIILNAELIAWLSQKFKETDHPEGEIYAHSLEKLVSSLNAMLSNSVTDDLAKLMYSGIEALLEQLDYYRNKNYWHDGISEILQDFLDKWSSTTNEILHLESQLFQHPELIPVRFYIPAMVLQFQRLIVQKAMDIIRQIDSTPGSEYVPIMLPKSQNNTTTMAILDPKEHFDYIGRSPLSIDVPIHMLYHPYRVSLILCHEIAHYCGNSIRNRSLRLQAIIDCISFYAAVRIIDYMELIEEGSILSEDDEAVLSRFLVCTGKMRMYVKGLVTDKIENGYLDDVMDSLSRNIGPIITNPEVINDFIRVLLEDMDASAQWRIFDKIQLESYDKYANIITSCQEHIKYCLHSMLQECFADVVMVLLSNCTFHDYYTCMFDDEYENLENKQYVSQERKIAAQEQLYETYTDRMALVACCINDIRRGWCDSKDLKVQDARWKIITCEKVNAWNQSCESREQPRKWKKWYASSSEKDYALLGYEATQILNYLNKCARMIQFKIQPIPIFKPIESVRKLRDQICLMKTDQMDWNKLQQILTESD